MEIEKPNSEQNVNSLKRKKLEIQDPERRISMPENHEEVKLVENNPEKGLPENDQIKLEVREEIKDDQSKSQNKSNQIIFHTQPIIDNK